MSRMIFCTKYKKEMEGLDAPPYPGPKGQEIFENVSKQAWQDWQSHQTMLINEKPGGPSGEKIPAGRNGQVLFRRRLRQG